MDGLSIGQGTVVGCMVPGTEVQATLRQQAKIDNENL